MIDSLGDRMKSFYEDRFRSNLPRRTNVMIRIDGKAFHTYTKGLNKPYDEGLMEDMDATTNYLCQNIQGAKMGYVQSDEISIWLTDYDDTKTDAWFDFNIQKMCSIAASLATAKFNQLRMARSCWEGSDIDGCLDADDLKNHKMAMFDARVFVLPTQDEVVNYFIWRQQDATRNSISMGAQSMYSHTELNGKSSSEKQELMFKKGVNWNDYPTRFKRGSVVIKQSTKWAMPIDEDGKPKGNPVKYSTAHDFVQLSGLHSPFLRTTWEAVETPIFTQDKEFITSQFIDKNS